MTDVLLAVGGLQILNVQLGSWIDEYPLLCVMLVSSIISYGSQLNSLFGTNKLRFLVV